MPEQLTNERVTAIKVATSDGSGWRPSAETVHALCLALEEARAEIMAHQVGDGYEKGYEHGSLTALKFKERAEKAEAQAWMTFQAGVPTLGEIANIFEKLKSLGVTRGSALWVVNRVWREDGQR